MTIIKNNSQIRKRSKKFNRKNKLSKKKSTIVNSKKIKPIRTKGGSSDELDMIQVNINIKDGEDFKVLVNPQDNIYQSVLKCSKDIQFRHIKNNIFLGENVEIVPGPDATFSEYGIEDGSTLTVVIARKGFTEVIDDIIELNPHLRDQRENLLSYTKYNLLGEPVGEEEININLEEPWRIKGHLDWMSKGITRIPESFGDLKIEGSLSLDRNHLISLPVSFGDLEVSEDLDLRNNRLHFIPKKFLIIRVGGDLILSGNDLKGKDNFPNVSGRVRF
tara:strand:- start:110 stop:934 length:825 start_codon:yes stop_codon:yes gene_type:complete